MYNSGKGCSRARSDAQQIAKADVALVALLLGYRD